MVEKIQEIEGRQQIEKEYRRQRKTGRGRAVGGGFGLGGALKGMAPAGALNATSGLAHSFANTVGNMGSSIAASTNKAAVYRDSKIAFSKALNEAILIIKNLFADDRKQMYRLLNTFMGCKCGMRLLVGEKICPKCS
ncbi:MAG TPA: hypothetical protein DCZ40_02345 [Lachnospiraceae bacterium]|nr:hypothetical protein [Lachnospiraceae bacterium]